MLNGLRIQQCFGKEQHEKHYVHLYVTLLLVHAIITKSNAVRNR